MVSVILCPNVVCSLKDRLFQFSEARWPPAALSGLLTEEQLTASQKLVQRYESWMLCYVILGLPPSCSKFKTLSHTDDSTVNQCG